ncbi:unnamed protein product, partial [Phaeothamnion confervicola]
ELSQLLPGWAPFIEHRLSDNNHWALPSGAGLKHALDEVFPLAGLRLEDHLLGTQALVDAPPGSDELSIAVLRHLEKLLSSESKTWCCASSKSEVDRWDIYHLFESAAESALVRHVAFLTNTQGRPAAALALLDTLDRTLRGHPSLLAERAWAALRLSRQ